MKEVTITVSSDEYDQIVKENRDLKEKVKQLEKEIEEMNKKHTEFCLRILS
jgi:cell division septum initiation protein DivIVA